MFGSSSSGSNATKLQSVAINSSNYGAPLTIVYGTGRASTNCLWYNNFKAHAQQQAGKGGSSGGSSYTYTAAVMLALCEGPILGVGNIYKDRGTVETTTSGGKTPLQQETLTLSLGTTSQSPWSYVTGAYPNQARAYAGTAWVANSNMALDSSAGLPNYNFEVSGLLQFGGSTAIVTALPAAAGTGYLAGDLITLTNGVQVRVSTIGKGGKVLTVALAYPYITSAPSNPVAQASTSGTGTGATFTLTVGGIIDANPADIIPDLLTNGRYGAGFPAGSIGDLSDYRDYCTAAGFFFSPVLDQQQQTQQYLSDWTSWSNSAIVWSQGQLKIIPYGDEPIVGNGVTWTPSLGSVVDFTDDDYIVGGTINGNAVQDDPIQVDRTSPSDAYNDYKIEWSDRSNNYNTAIAEAMDQAAIDLNGLRAQSTVTAHGITVQNTAQVAIRLMQQRGLYLRNAYTLTVSPLYGYLEPMDIVTVTHPLLRFDLLPLRIVSIEEDDNMNLQITAEDLIIGVGTAVGETVQTGGTIAITPYADPGNVSNPVMLNAPQNLTNGALELWIAASGGENWGGADLWISFDDTTYQKAGTLENPSRYGITTADFPAGSDPDTVNTLSLDLTESEGTLDSATDAQADSGATLAWVNGELICYSTATLTGTNTYNLTGYIRRGQQATAIADHPSGAQFVRLDDTIFNFGYNSNQIGSTIYIKFLSFNVYGNKTQDLADVSPYSIVLGIAPPDMLGFNISVDPAGTTALFSWPANQAAAVTNGGAVEIRYENVTSGASWGTADFVGSAAGNATSIDLPFIAGGTYLAKSVSADGVYCNDPVFLGSGTATGGGPLAITLSPSGSISGTTSTGMAPKTGICTANVTGGTPPYTFSWTYSSGSINIIAMSPASPATKFQDPSLDSTGAPGTDTGAWHCTVTDSVSATVSSADIAITLTSTFSL